MSDETNDPGKTSADQEAQATHEGNSHADHVRTGEETRDALQRWGSSSPGQNTLVPTGDSEPPADDEKLPNQS